jgi:hypothetical protein
MILALGCLWIILCGALRLPDMGKVATVAFMLALSANACVTAAGYSGMLESSYAFEPWVLCAVYLLTACLVWFAESLFAETFILLGLVIIVTWIIKDCVIFSDCDHLALDPPTTAFCFLAMGCIFLLLRLRFWWRAVKAVEGDKNDYDTEWLKLSSENFDTSRLDSLASFTAHISASCQPNHSRHYNRLREPPQSLRPLLSGFASNKSSWGSLTRVLRFTSQAARARFHVPDSIPATIDLNSPVSLLPTSSLQLHTQ